jgi:O-antigen ligase
MFYVIGGLILAVLSIKTFNLSDWLNKTIITLTIINLAAMLYSSNPYYAKIAFVFNVVGLLIMLSFTQIDLSIDHILKFTIIIGFVGSLITIFLLPQAGFLGNTNYTGHWLAIPTVWCIWFLLNKTLLWAIPLPVILYAQYVTHCRTAWIAVIISTYIIVIYKTKSIKLTIITTLSIAILVITAIHLSPGFTLDTTGFSFRIKYWTASLQMIYDNPLFGTGLRSYRNGVYEAQAKQGVEFFKGYESPKPRHVHNDYLEIINDSGLIGFMLIAYLFIKILHHGWVVKQEAFPLVIGLIVCMLGMIGLFWRTLPLHTFTIAALLGSIERCSRRSVR